VALLNHRDQHHQWVRHLLDTIVPPLLTCEPVLSEACFLLQNVHGGADAVLELLDREVLELRFSLAEEWNVVRRLMRKYQNRPMSLADACLVRMAEQFPRSHVLTLDQDFLIYRKQRRQRVPVLMPSDG
jgi:predicted nucleic acid-binding protein